MAFKSMNNQQLQPIMRHWRIIFFLWIILTIFTSAFGISSLVISPMHPIYFVLMAILPSTVFLIISLITSHSIFSQLFIGLKNLIFKNDSASTFQSKLPIRYIVQLVSNTTWITILLTSIVVLFFKFTFQHVDFYLGNTFTESKEITESVIRYLNFFPEKLGFINFDYKIIEASFIKDGLNDAARSLWAKWTIIMILFHGLLPRILVFGYYVVRSLSYSKPQSTVSQPIILDQAEEKPLVIRAPKVEVHGNDHYQVALDITDQIRLSPDVIKLNDIETFQQFELKHKAEPIEKLAIFVDGNLMPDRGLLRRMIRLLNLAEHATIHVLTQDDYQKSMWHKHLSSVLVEGEAVNYDIQ